MLEWKRSRALLLSFMGELRVGLPQSSQCNKTGGVLGHFVLGKGWFWLLPPHSVPMDMPRAQLGFNPGVSILSGCNWYRWLWNTARLGKKNLDSPLMNWEKGITSPQAPHSLLLLLLFQVKPPLG